MKRVFLIVMDSFGIGEAPDADIFGDAGSNTLRSCMTSPHFFVPNLTRLGLMNIDGVEAEGVHAPVGAFARLSECSAGKDTVTGHWEMSGIISRETMPVFPQGFPQQIIEQIESISGRRVVCNMSYSGTQVIQDYGEQHLQDGSLIVYTSADSVLQIAAHEQVVPIDELYEICARVRRLMKGKFGVGRIIARPFVGNPDNFVRTSNRHDFALEPTGETLLDILCAANKEVISVGKIADIFSGRGITDSYRTTDNMDGCDKLLSIMDRDFNGLCFVNLVDFDMLYGHRNDVEGYARAVSMFDARLGEILPMLKEDDVLIITADHGCDPATPSTDHSREYVPCIVYGKHVKPVNLGTRRGFGDIAATILDLLDVSGTVEGHSFAAQVVR